MRLIDADKLIEQFEKVKNESTCLADIAQIIGVQCVIDEQPTDYDPDKVVEELDKLADKANDKILEDAALCLYYDGYKDAIRTAVEIVKGGGVDA